MFVMMCEDDPQPILIGETLITRDFAASLIEVSRTPWQCGRSSAGTTSGYRSPARMPAAFDMGCRMT